MSVKHAFVSAKSNGADATLVRPSDWNNDHVIDFVAPAGITGSTAASRYVGGTTSGAPVAGTFLLGDFVIDQTGKAWICTVAGSPGTWTQLAGGFSDPTTTKGDFIVHGTTTTRFPVSTDGFVITADSTQTLGVKWAAAGGSVPAAVSAAALINAYGAFR